MIYCSIRLHEKHWQNLNVQNSSPRLGLHEFWKINHTDMQSIESEDNESRPTPSYNALRQHLISRKLFQLTCWLKCSCIPGYNIRQSVCTTVYDVKKKKKKIDTIWYLVTGWLDIFSNCVSKRYDWHGQIFSDLCKQQWSWIEFYTHPW